MLTSSWSMTSRPDIPSTTPIANRRPKGISRLSRSDSVRSAISSVYQVETAEITLTNAQAPMAMPANRPAKLINSNLNSGICHGRTMARYAPIKKMLKVTGARTLVISRESRLVGDSWVRRITTGKTALLKMTASSSPATTIAAEAAYAPRILFNPKFSSNPAILRLLPLLVALARAG